VHGGFGGGCSILKKFVVAAKALTKSAQAQQLLRALKRNNKYGALKRNNY